MLNSRDTVESVTGNVAGYIDLIGLEIFAPTGDAHGPLRAHPTRSLPAYGCVTYSNLPEGPRAELTKQPVVYLIQRDDRIKIGYSTNLKTRLRALKGDRVLLALPGGALTSELCPQPDFKTPTRAGWPGPFS
ncbi:hypothetical protein ACFXKD_10730 [Nocardiopsis aegyptia]|uniref:hypothetical protein n=1 Tax=Nocardiopsis aegyptia TaxID=220378 RepID=UPI00366F3F53